MIDRPAKAEAGAAERAGLAAHLAAHRPGDTVDNRQAEAAASCRPVPAGVKADKGLKHPLALLGAIPGPSSSTSNDAREPCSVRLTATRWLL